MRIWFPDIETCPMLAYTFRLGNQYITHDQIYEENGIICLSSKYKDKKVITQKWTKTKCDKHIIEYAAEQIDKSDYVVAQNGDRFDIPWLRGRAMYHGLPFPTEVRSFDTYRKQRGKINYPCLKLDYLAKKLYGRGKVDTGGLPLWIACHQGDEAALKKMIRYCEMDVRLLEKLFNTVKDYVPTNMHHGVLMGHEKWSCPTCGSRKVKLSKQYATKAGTPRYAMKCDKHHHFVLSKTEYAKYEENI